MTRWKADLVLLLVAAVWGSGFVAQRLAAASLGTFYFNGGRFLLAALLLLPLTRLKWRGPRDRLPLMGAAGVLLFGAAGFQQAGLATTSIGNVSFITGLYVVLVPLLVFVIWRNRISWLSVAATFIAAVGVGLLSLSGEFQLAPGDILALIGAFLWAFHVILVGRLADQGVDVLWFAVTQFAVCGVLSLALALALDLPGAAAVGGSWLAILYSAVVPIGIGFTLQAAGQKGAPPVDAAIILSMEAVFGTLFGYLILQELLSGRQLLGCALILAAMILAQFRAPAALSPAEPAPG